MTLQRFSPPAPANAYLWRMNPGRMEAEALRDSLLHLAGELDTTMGGRELETAEAATSRRRGLYFSIYPEAGGHEEFLTQFDPPNPERLLSPDEDGHPGAGAGDVPTADCR